MQFFCWKMGRRREVQPSDSFSFSLFLTCYGPKTKEVQKLGGFLCLHDGNVARVICANQWQKWVLELESFNFATDVKTMVSSCLLSSRCLFGPLPPFAWTIFFQSVGFLPSVGIFFSFLSKCQVFSALYFVEIYCKCRNFFLIFFLFAGFFWV